MNKVVIYVEEEREQRVSFYTSLPPVITPSLYKDGLNTTIVHKCTTSGVPEAKLSGSFSSQTRVHQCTVYIEPLVYKHSKVRWCTPHLHLLGRYHEGI